jgi:four helix bundle protein
VSDFKKLRVWHAAQALAIDVNRVVGRMRGSASATQRDQLVRSAGSVPGNIVEGRAHESPREFSRYLGYSITSVTEVEGHIILARALGRITEKDYTSLLNQVVDVRKMLYGLKKKLDEDGPSESGRG